MFSLYYVIDNYFFIDYLCCQSKTISDISRDKVFENKSYNELLGIGIPEVIMNLISCHGFTKNTISNFILVCHYWLVNYNYAKGFVIIEHNSQHSRSVPNETKQLIHAINKQKKDYVIACYTYIYSAANTLKQIAHSV